MICDKAADKSNVGRIKRVITEATEEFKALNPEGMAARNGEKVLKPSW